MKKIILITVLILALAGGIFAFLYMQKRKKDEEGNNTDGDYKETAKKLISELAGDTPVVFTPGTVVTPVKESEINAPVQTQIVSAREQVRQMYLDYLGREPDSSGWDYWTGIAETQGLQTARDHIYASQEAVDRRTKAASVPTEATEEQLFPVKLYWLISNLPTARADREWFRTHGINMTWDSITEVAKDHFRRNSPQYQEAVNWALSFDKQIRPVASGWLEDGALAVMTNQTVPDGDNKIYLDGVHIGSARMMNVNYGEARVVNHAGYLYSTRNRNGWTRIEQVPREMFDYEYYYSNREDVRAANVDAYNHFYPQGFLEFAVMRVKQPTTTVMPNKTSVQQSIMPYPIS